jgi:type IV pilus assembly protein PilA
MKRNSCKEKKQKGFTIIELMMVVSIIGILASIALPMYMDYTTRAKVSEAVNLLGGLKMPMVEYFWAENRWPSVALVGGKPSGIYTSLVESMTWSEGGTTLYGVQATMRADPKIGNKKLLMRYIPEIVDWECTTNGLGNDGIPQTYLPAPCRD